MASTTDIGACRHGNAALQETRCRRTTGPCRSATDAGDLLVSAAVIRLLVTPAVFDLDVADTALGASTPIAGHQLTETVQKGRTRHWVPAAPVITLIFFCRDCRICCVEFGSYAAGRFFPLLPAMDSPRIEIGRVVLSVPILCQERGSLQHHIRFVEPTRNRA